MAEAEARPVGRNVEWEILGNGDDRERRSYRLRRLRRDQHERELTQQIDTYRAGEGRGLSRRIGAREVDIAAFDEHQRAGAGRDIGGAGREIVGPHLVGEVIMTAPSAEHEPPAFGTAQGDMRIAVRPRGVVRSARCPLGELGRLRLGARLEAWRVVMQGPAIVEVIERVFGPHDVALRSIACGRALGADPGGELDPRIVRDDRPRFGRYWEDAQSIPRRDLTDELMQRFPETVDPRVSETLERRFGWRWTKEPREVREAWVVPQGTQGRERIDPGDRFLRVPYRGVDVAEFGSRGFQYIGFAADERGIAATRLRLGVVLLGRGWQG
ncbi:hypothetical protein LVJ94_48760 [Pendulispora rubella]|uniref:Uncharacterized protein n=1 Tax=Pendulispora rubella TaxID=2741070 RepID=A0ABZ2L1U6_9BACT